MKVKINIKDCFKIGVLCLILLLLAYYSEQSGGVMQEDGTLERNAFGKGSKKVDLVLNAEGLEENYPYELKLKEVRITEQEAKKYFQQAINEIQETLYAEGDNESHVEQNLNLSRVYVDGLVSADWNFGGSYSITHEGKIRQDHLPEEGEVVHVKVELTCDEYKELYEFFMQVYPMKLTKGEQLLRRIQMAIDQEEERYGEESLRLPDEVDGTKLSWSNPQEHMVQKVFLLELVILVVLYFAAKEKEKDAFKARQESMRLDYSDIVSKLAILVGAGMSLKQAWNTISARYLADRKENIIKERPAYEEMVATFYEMQDGASERAAFQNFSERVGIGEYHRLSRILIQSIQKGTRGICGMLEQEAADAFETRKLLARKYGEEASTKMMIPLMMMLGIVMAMIMVPALMGVKL